MLEIEGSLKYRGKAIVARDKNGDDPDIAIIPIEMSGENEGEFEDFNGTLHSKYVDRLGNVIIKQCTFSEVVYARWYKSGNRSTAPNVTMGETVHLYEFDNTRVWFWKEDPRTDHLRGLEHIEFLISNVADQLDDPTHEEYRTSDNAYQLLFSTREKLLQLKTNKFNGEAFEHLLQIDSKGSVFRYKDDKGLLIEADSATDKITVRNHAGTTVVLDKNDLTAEAIAAATVKAKTAKVKATDVKVEATKVQLECDELSSTAKKIDFSEAAVNTKSIHAPHAPSVLPPV